MSAMRRVLCIVIMSISLLPTGACAQPFDTPSSRPTDPVTEPVAAPIFVPQTVNVSVRIEPELYEALVRSGRARNSADVQQQVIQRVTEVDFPPVRKLWIEAINRVCDQLSDAELKELFGLAETIRDRN